MPSVIIPAHNEEAWIAPCLQVLLDEAAPTGGAEVVIAANGCQDETVARAHIFEPMARVQGWGFVLLDLSGLGKPAALNSGDAAAFGGKRLCLDADVSVGSGVIAALVRALDTTETRYASARPIVARGLMFSASGKI